MKQTVKLSVVPEFEMFYCIRDKEMPMFSLFHFGRCYNVTEKAEGWVCVSDAFFPQDLSIRIACFLFKTC